MHICVEERMCSLSGQDNASVVRGDLDGSSCLSCFRRSDSDHNLDSL